MYIFENIRLAFDSLVNNKLRSLLTMLGIIIGISSVITITTIGSSLKTTLANTLASAGNNGFYLNYSRLPDEDGNYDYTTPISKDYYVTNDMLKEMTERFDGKYQICSEAGLGTGTIRNSKGQTLSVGLEGMSEGTMIAEKSVLRLIGGRYLNDADDQQHKHACVVSDIFVQQYFQDGSDPIGASINVDVIGLCNTDFVIVGVFKFPAAYEKTIDPGTSLMDRSTLMCIPYHVALDLSGQEEEVNRYPQINVRDSSYDAESCKAELQSFFNEKFANNDMLSVIVKSDQEDMEQLDMVLTIITVVISIIAAISLLVGGIGVMNIMLVSITERTREIGVRKAIGAQSTTIRNQFLIEAIIMCLSGGGIGIMLGILNGLLVGIIGTKLINYFFPLYAELVTIQIQPSIAAILLSVFFSILIGVFFGTYPASKAAKMNPIDALRYE